MASSKGSKTKHKGKGVRKALRAAIASLDIHSHQVDTEKQQHHDHDNAHTNTTNTNMRPSGKQLSTTAVNIKRREDYANMDPASKDRERTRVKRSRAGKMARDSLPDTAWAELGRRAQADVADAIADEIRFKYDEQATQQKTNTCFLFRFSAATTPGPSSRTAAEYAVQKVFADKLHLFFPKEKRHNQNEEECCADDFDAMDVDSNKDAEEDVGDTERADDWVPSELTRGWQGIVGDGVESTK
ncbi:hypothetical protein PG997_014179 [Apiospora hydei]|uniref:Uncharacterized protein n=1 Tax=Apiospora hydei TaxID=1337664 RepID=A0ABR1UT60_9PEZI